MLLRIYDICTSVPMHRAGIPAAASIPENGRTTSQVNLQVSTPEAFTISFAIRESRM